MRTMLNTHGPLLQPTRFNDECVQILPLQWRKGLKVRFSKKIIWEWLTRSMLLI